jgi:hypothetical protein
VNATSTWPIHSASLVQKGGRDRQDRQDCQLPPKRTVSRCQMKLVCLATYRQDRDTGSLRESMTMTLVTLSEQP